MSNRSRYGIAKALGSVMPGNLRDWRAPSRRLGFSGYYPQAGFPNAFAILFP